MPRKPTGQPSGRRPRTAAKAEHSVRIRVTAEELDGLRAAATAAGVSVSEFVRTTCLSHM
jgi:uncharacterized protein (DUF1778 family)